MSLQATLILLDNSAYALNGDYLPTRWQSQVDCAGLLIQSKLQSNMQSSVGLGLMGGKQALQIGSLALKHRSNQTQKQRIVCFIASTITQDVDTLKIFAKKLKKNGIAVDLVCFGDCSQEQRNKIETFYTTVNQDDNSHRIFIEPGDVYLSEKLLGSQIFISGGGGAAMGGMEVDDPELAEAIRLSLQQNNVQAANQPQAQSQPQQAQSQGERQPTEQQLEQLAIKLSLQQANEQQKKEEKKQQKIQQEKHEDSKKQKKDDPQMKD